jgi:multidrug efflux pump subunit AcrB
MLLRGPMAYANIGGLFVATLLTLLLLPTLYFAWFRIKEPRKEREPHLVVRI